MRGRLSGEVRRLLSGARLISTAPANVGVGERRSRSVGAGIEFAEYRDYEPGDDLRHLDRHVYARHGRAVVKQYHVEQRLRVSVLLDGSGSMAADPTLWSRAVQLAAVFGEVALNGSDQVRFGVTKHDRVEWGGTVSRDRQLWRELDRLGDVRPGGAQVPMNQLAARSLEALAAPGVLVVISDWLVEGFAEALRAWRVREQEVVAVQVLGAAESGTEVGPTGWVRLIDAESGAVIDRRADRHTWRAYRSAVSEWSEAVRSAVWSVEGRWLSVAAGGALNENVVRDLRAQGVIT